MTQAPTEKTLGKKLRDAREAAPLRGEERAKKRRRHPYPTQHEIADRIRVDRSQYTSWENDRNSIPAPAAIKLEREFKKPAGYFREDEPPSSVAKRFLAIEKRLSRLEQTIDDLVGTSPTSPEGRQAARRSRRAGSQR